MPERNYELVVLGKDEYHQVYGIAFTHPESPPKEELAAEYESFDKALRETLSQNWEIDPIGGNRHDFAISDEWQESFHHCGGIYSKRICCLEYVQAIINVISGLPHSHQWTYHTAVECLDGGISAGEFFIRDGKMYVPDDGNNYLQYFSSSETRVTKREQSLTIHIAADKGDVQKIREMLAVDPSLLHSKDNLQRTPLHRAVDKHQAKAVTLLLDSGADLNLPDVLGYTPLHIASAGRGSKKIAELLLERRPEVDARDTSGMTPLHLAVLCKHHDIVGILLTSGFAPNSRDNLEATPVFYAIGASDNTKGLKILLSAGAELNVGKKLGYTPLHEAAKLGAVSIAELLVANGSNVKSTNQYGSDPLFEAAYNGHKKMVKFLLVSGANPNLKNQSGVTSLQMAALQGFKNIVKLLLASGADVNARDGAGNTALGKAIKNGHNDVARLLRQHGGEE